MQDLSSNKSRPVNPTTGKAFFKLFYSYLSPNILTALVVGLVLFRISMGNWSYADLIAPATILLLWPLVEWMIHVHILHAKPRKIFGRTFDLPVSLKHRSHHQNPSDLSDITIKREVFPTVVPVLFILAYLAFPTAELATGALAMFFALAWHYEFAHFACHTKWCPPIEFYRRRQRMHRLHHFRDEKLWWGVSMGMADVLLGTAPDGRNVSKSPTVHNVHGLMSE